MSTCVNAGCDEPTVNLSSYCRPHLLEARLAWVVAEEAKHEHDRRCCRKHETHSSPHVGCMLR